MQESTFSEPVTSSDASTILIAGDFGLKGETMCLKPECLPILVHMASALAAMDGIAG